jgi:hypothetical protein
MRHRYKGFKENPLILREKKIYKHQSTKKKEKRENLKKCILYPARWRGTEVE